MSGRPVLFSVVELGGYPDFTARYQAAGFEVVAATSMRKAIALLKRHRPAVVVAEFNYQSDFRDRTSNLESLLATLQTRSPEARVIVFYEEAHGPHLARLQARFPLWATLKLPANVAEVAQALAGAAAG